ncbi:ferritin-like domain-containing protein [Nitrosomonas sp. Nm34]|uniref:ferritin-like domain-containing protein n=1 Tax=Nitrosomonas sp. Nm34 TaxID=1881055 RepID=UPI0008EF26F4|nr:ferritin-like domain-containing protein [Nitrosomonas sp. Nm34]SFI87165.1 bacterioferritin [Nitrosomonas sp. Nm34]
MKRNADIINWLNRQLLHQVICHQSVFSSYPGVQESGFSQPGEHEYHESIEKIKYADKLVECILFLEELPNLQDLEKLLIGESPQEYVTCDLTLEDTSRETLLAAIAAC